MENKFKKYYWVGFILLILVSCVGSPEYPIIPQISQNNVTKTRESSGDSIKVALDFKDGDGDLGLGKADTSGAYAPLNIDQTNNKFYFNYWFDILVKRNNTWEEIPFASGYNFNGRYPKLYKEGRKGPLRGTLYYGIFIPDIAVISGYLNKNDTVKFKIQIVDRALNVSNVIETNEVILDLK